MREINTLTHGYVIYSEEHVLHVYFVLFVVVVILVDDWNKQPEHVVFLKRRQSRQEIRRHHAAYSADGF